jgi:hypothetical protein
VTWHAKSGEVDVKFVRSECDEGEIGTVMVVGREIEPCIVHYLNFVT